jgi:hypothetical protein
MVESRGKHTIVTSIPHDGDKLHADLQCLDSIGLFFGYLCNMSLPRQTSVNTPSDGFTVDAHGQSGYYCLFFSRIR